MRLVLITFFIAICAPLVQADLLPLSADKVHPAEYFPGGKTTAKHRHNRHSFSQAAANLSLEKRLDFRVGNAVFDKIWVFAPASTTASDGLGPLYNARSCVRCHQNNGRGRPHSGDFQAPLQTADLSLLLKLSVPAKSAVQKEVQARNGFVPEPNYGGQLQTFAWVGGKAEAKLQLSYSQKTVRFADGEEVMLNAPTYHLADIGYGELAPEMMSSPRLAPALIGLGLLEAIAEQDLYALADPDDRDQNGISGRVNRVWDIAQQKYVAGRFGWKAASPSIAQQNAAALSNDIGIGSALFPKAEGDCTQQQNHCLEQPTGNSEIHDNLEASEKMTDLLVLYMRYLAVPKRKQAPSPSVLAGRELFHAIGCADCHRPAFKTGTLAGEPELSGQIIWPYTDLLLHDMGAHLADNRPEFSATGREWRTPPLWGIGLNKAVNGNNFYLHDGRASSLMEAILWHGGEAKASQQRVLALSKAERENLIKFLESL